MMADAMAWLLTSCQVVGNNMGGVVDEHEGKARLAYELKRDSKRMLLDKLGEHETLHAAHGCHISQVCRHKARTRAELDRV